MHELGKIELQAGKLYETKRPGFGIVKIVCDNWDGDYPFAGYAIDTEHMNIDDILLWDINGVSSPYQYDGWDIVGFAEIKE